mgnify:CR=1 FL=1
MNRWKDWNDQGQRDLEKSKLDLRFGYYEWACFTAQQAAEKVIQGLGLKLGISLWGHSLTEMLNILSSRIEIPENIKNEAKQIALYYIPPRYPNGFASGKPADFFTEKQGKGAVNAAEISSGSVTAFFLDRKELVNQLKGVCREAIDHFPECLEIRLFGSIASETHTGLSDVDIFILVDKNRHSNPLERMRPYFNFFSEKLDIATDVIVANIAEVNQFKEILKGSIIMAKREKKDHKINSRKQK